jgi:hypothetical protein
LGDCECLAQCGDFVAVAASQFLQLCGEGTHRCGCGRRRAVVGGGGGGVVSAVGGAHLLDPLTQLGLAVEEVGRDVGVAGDAGKADCCPGGRESCQRGGRPFSGFLMSSVGGVAEVLRHLRSSAGWSVTPAPRTARSVMSVIDSRMRLRESISS